jgi:plastocyanin
MKRIVTTILGVMCIVLLSYANTFTISTSGFSFSLPTTNIIFGDTVIFNVGGGHTATEVSQSTWNSNGTTSNGGFNFSSGSDQLLTGLTVGTHYFVCQIHVGSMGMKGQIVVSAVSQTKQNQANQIKILPNPVKNFIQLENISNDLNRITITGVDGKTLRNWQVDSTPSSIQVGDLPKGIYFLAGYTDDKQLWIEKFEKQ